MHSGPRVLPLLAVPAAALGLLLAWLLADAAGIQASAISETVAVLCGSLVLGLAVLPMLGVADPIFDERLHMHWRLAAWAAVLWTIAEAVSLILNAGASSGDDAFGVSIGELHTALSASTTVRSVALTVVLAAVVAALAAYAYRREPSWAPPILAVFAMLTLVVPMSGHMSQQTFGSLLNALHVIAAALWSGTLGALALTVRSKHRWAQWMPKVSNVALASVAVLTLTGTVNAIVRLGDIEPFVTTGYGRILTAKIVLLCVLLVFGWLWQTRWMRSVQKEVAASDITTKHIVGEVLVQIVVFGLAAGLAAAA